MRELFGVVRNEWMKLVRRRRLWITSILGLLVVGLYATVVYHGYRSSLAQNHIEQERQSLVTMQQQVAQLRSQPATPATASELAGMQLQIEQIQLDLGTGNVNWRTVVKSEIQDMNAQIQMQEQQTGQPSSQRQQLMMLQYDLAHNVKPMPQWQNSSYNDFTQFLDLGSRLFLPLLVVLLIADMVSGEATSGTIKLLLIRPVSRLKILLGKWGISLFVSALFTAVFCVVLWLSGALVEGFAGASQPVVVGIRYVSEKVAQNVNGIASDQLTLIPHFEHAVAIAQWQFSLAVIGLTILAMMVMATVTLFLSTLFRSSMASTAIAMGLVIIGTIVIQIAQAEKWISWFFITHLALMTNWTGQMVVAHQSLTLLAGVTVLIVTAVIAIVIAMIDFQRRDVLNA